LKFAAEQAALYFKGGSAVLVFGITTAYPACVLSIYGIARIAAGFVVKLGAWLRNYSASLSGLCYS
jgi:hypothetical protein